MKITIIILCAVAAICGSTFWGGTQQPSATPTVPSQAQEQSAAKRLAADPLMAEMLKRAQESSGDLVLVQSNRDSGLDLLSNLPRVLVGNAATGENILVQVTRNQFFSKDSKVPRSGWIQVDDKRYPLQAVSTDSLFLFGYAKAPSRQKIDALDFTIAFCVDDEVSDTDQRALIFVETRYTPHR